ncbi:hypothetical protein O181_128232 [Austropuccinia psidii MF-1]|uniref:Uncharacterized protein n=1 Tax=Austropuccinia psidii MF-1 TaxID=1389203 RepID=A0A9Q3QA98_9BASI|nr:hypothetical protein [Austropuccinia psidii MF-1]
MNVSGINIDVGNTKAHTSSTWSIPNISVTPIPPNPTNTQMDVSEGPESTPKISSKANPQSKNSTFMWEMKSGLMAGDEKDHWKEKTLPFLVFLASKLRGNQWLEDLFHKPSQTNEPPIPGPSPSSEPHEDVQTREPESEVALTQSMEEHFACPTPPHSVIIIDDTPVGSPSPFSFPSCPLSIHSHPRDPNRLLPSFSC